MADRKELVERLSGFANCTFYYDAYRGPAPDGVPQLRSDILVLIAALSEQEKPVATVLDDLASTYPGDLDGSIREAIPSPAGPVAGLREAAQAVCDFAWSAVSADCDESREYLNKLVSDLRAAIAVLATTQGDLK